MFETKNSGGLGLKDFETRNESFLIKHIWNIAVKKDSLWVKWISIVKLKDRSTWEIQSENNDT